MMKMKSLLGMALAVLFLAVGMWQAQPVAADYTGVEGTVYDSVTNPSEPWEHGFKVTIIYYDGTDVVFIEEEIGASGSFNINIPDTPLDPVVNVTVYIDFEYGGSGEPQRLRFRFPSDGDVGTFNDWSGHLIDSGGNPIADPGWADGEIFTGTGPTSVALVGLGATQVGPTAVYALIMLLLVISTAAFVVVRRRSQYSA